MIREDATMLFFRFPANGDGVFELVEKSKMILSSVNLDSYSPFLRQFVPINASMPTGIVGLKFLIPSVLRRRCFPKIFPSAVSRVAVFMISLVRRNAPFHVNEGKKMREVQVASVDADHEVSVSVDASSFLSGPALIPFRRTFRAIAPSPCAGSRIVIQNRSKIGLSDIVDIGHGLLHQIVARAAQLVTGGPLILSKDFSVFNLR